MLRVLWCCLSRTLGIDGKKTKLQSVSHVFFICSGLTASAAVASVITCTSVSD